MARRRNDSVVLEDTEWSTVWRCQCGYGNTGRDRCLMCSCPAPDRDPGQPGAPGRGRVRPAPPRPGRSGGQQGHPHRRRHHRRQPADADRDGRRLRRRGRRAGPPRSRSRCSSASPTTAWPPCGCWPGRPRWGCGRGSARRARPSGRPRGSWSARPAPSFWWPCSASSSATRCSTRPPPFSPLRDRSAPWSWASSSSWWRHPSWRSSSSAASSPSPCGGGASGPRWSSAPWPSAWPT